MNTLKSDDVPDDTTYDLRYNLWFTNIEDWMIIMSRRCVTFDLAENKVWNPAL